ncbi:hypothetical protein BKA83DRAFT_4129793 [Pisolithus microcarpus]|nr:hypothetical protein BKA83DRAFT_4129793 [Pisolithus microcarpus]
MDSLNDTNYPYTTDIEDGSNMDTGVEESNAGEEPKQVFDMEELEILARQQREWIQASKKKKSSIFCALLNQGMEADGIEPSKSWIDLYQHALTTFMEDELTEEELEATHKCTKVWNEIHAKFCAGDVEHSDSSSMDFNNEIYDGNPFNDIHTLDGTWPITGLSCTRKQQMVHGFLTTHYIGSIPTAEEMIALQHLPPNFTFTVDPSHMHVTTAVQLLSFWHAWQESNLGDVFAFQRYPERGVRHGKSRASQDIDAQTDADTNAETNAEINGETDAETGDDTKASSSQLPQVMHPVPSSSKCCWSKTPMPCHTINEEDSNDDENSASGDVEGNVPDHHKCATAKRSKVKPQVIHVTGKLWGMGKYDDGSIDIVPFVDHWTSAKQTPSVQICADSHIQLNMATYLIYKDYISMLMGTASQGAHPPPSATPPSGGSSEGGMTTTMRGDGGGRGKSCVARCIGGDSEVEKSTIWSNRTATMS